MLLRIMSWTVFLLGLLLVPAIVVIVFGRYFPHSSTSLEVGALVVCESLWIILGNYLLVEKAKSKAKLYTTSIGLITKLDNKKANRKVPIKLSDEALPDERLIDELFPENKELAVRFANPQLARIAHKIRQRSRKELQKGTTLIVLGCVEVPALFLVLAILVQYLGFITVPIGIVFFYWIVRTFRLAKRYLNNPYAQLSGDTRRPILYLRSFVDDSAINSQRRDRKTYEEILINAANNIGPVIAVGEPNEKLPRLGAFRIYFDDAEWKAGVLYLMSISQAIMLHADITRGLLWELNTVRHKSGREKLVISFHVWHEYDAHTRQNLYESFKENAEGILGCSLPANIGDAVFLVFENNWKPKLVEINNRWKKKLFENATFLRVGSGSSSRQIHKALRSIIKET